MLKKSKDKIRHELDGWIDGFCMPRPDMHQTPQQYFDNLEYAIRELLHQVTDTLIDNIYDEQEISNKVDGILLEKNDETEN